MVSQKLKITEFVANDGVLVKKLTMASVMGLVEL
jgi:hypothetical protein